MSLDETRQATNVDVAEGENFLRQPGLSPEKEKLHDIEDSKALYPAAGHPPLLRLVSLGPGWSY